MANVSKLLYSRGGTCFLQNIDLSEGADARLREAKKKIRTHLRQTFAALSRERLGVVVTPRFYTQGSHAYKTINAPARVPPQQMDLDDGCYLPLTFVKEEKPSKAASAFFEVVDAALTELAAREGWTFVKKPTCARVVISRDAHVDVPLYAIPDGEFRTLEEAVAKDARIRGDSAARASVDRWEDLPSNASGASRGRLGVVRPPPDPQMVRRRRRPPRRAPEARVPLPEGVARPPFPGVGPLSSIILMACACRAFDEVGRPNMPERDDLAMLKVVERLPDYMRGEIENPSDRAEKLCSRLSDEARRDAVAKAESLKAEMGAIIGKCVSESQAIEGMRELLGARIPNDVSLVSVAESATVEVLRNPPRHVPAPTVGRSQSG